MSNERERALEAAHRVRNCDYGMMDENDALLVARALLASSPPVSNDPMGAARIVERVMTEWGKQDSLRDMLEEITAELAASSPPPSGEKLWLWRDGKDRFLAFRSLFPLMPDDGDPATIGQPSGYAFYHPMTLAESQKVSREAARAALDANRTEEPWQPIKTAPKDGTTLILCGNPKRYGKPIQFGYWDDWRNAWSSFGPDGDVVAWQHLPAPPNRTEEKS